MKIDEVVAQTEQVPASTKPELAVTAVKGKCGNASLI
jgi:hypothetical protein